MKFLNKKEQVFDIQLTPYGKQKLSMGKLNPTYYAFLMITCSTTFSMHTPAQQKSRTKRINASSKRPPTLKGRCSLIRFSPAQRLRADCLMKSPWFRKIISTQQMLSLVTRYYNHKNKM